METIQLNGWKFTSKEIMYKILKNKLDLPNYYGENADVLWDCLTAWRTSFKRDGITEQDKAKVTYLTKFEGMEHIKIVLDKYTIRYNRKNQSTVKRNESSAIPDSHSNSRLIFV